MAKKKKVEEEEIEAPKEKTDEAIDKIAVLAQVKKMNKKYGKVASISIKQRDPFIPRLIEEKIRQEIPRMRVITANDLAAKYDIRVSAVKKLLLAMEKEGKLKRLASSSRLKVFNPV
ncbi:MAG: hypothetical protein DRO88_12370 [Promethearchaeia archaeon]|nr:MAG: hypothetical protein DRO88_12370 [Candidatus Lokiarchaeia archaeon]